MHQDLEIWSQHWYPDITLNYANVDNRLKMGYCTKVLHHHFYLQMNSIWVRESEHAVEGGCWDAQRFRDKLGEDAAFWAPKIIWNYLQIFVKAVLISWMGYPLSWLIKIIQGSFIRKCCMFDLIPFVVEKSHWTVFVTEGKAIPHLKK